MDDPWGSPWATNDPNPVLEPPPRASTTLELPGRILTRNRSSSNISPWAIEDDGLSDWGAADPGLSLPPTTATTNAWSGWTGETGLNASQTSLTTRAREGSLGLPSPPPWPTAASSGLLPGKTLSRKSSTLSFTRQPSPDPWAAEFSENQLSLPAAAHISAEQSAFAALDRHEEVEVEDGAIKSKEEEGRPGPEAEVERTPGADVTPVPPLDRDVEVEPDAHVDREPGEQGREDQHPDSLSASRHSSVSNESQHEERLDSPITSMDEDSKDRVSIPRRPSAKVQEMVNLYDGLLKKVDSTLLVPDQTRGRQRSASRAVSIQSARTDEASDFGDFEDAEEFVPSRQPSGSGSPRPASSRGTRLRSISKTALRNVAAATASVTSPIAEEAPHKFQELRIKYGPVKFTPDLDLVDKLFDVEQLEKAQPTAKDYSLDAVDGIIKDSFTEISERRTWYRISRPGTKRKHDMGDDDNYRRATWEGSKVREDATTIVRRWMEEDTYTGRPAIGGGSMIKGGGFNWDSKAEPREALSFDQIFGKRKSAQPPKAAAAQIPRPLSLQPQPTTSVHSRNSSVGVKSLPPRSPLSIPAPPAGPAFGWSTGANDSLTPTSSRPSGQFVRQSLEVSSIRSGTSRAPSFHEPESRSSLQLAPPPPSRPQQPPKLKTVVQAIKDDDDDEEEWGEMVASPADESHPASALFDSSMNGSMANLSTTGSAPPVSVPDTRSTLDAVTSKLENGQKETHQGISAMAPADVWDFSAFDSGPVAPSVPPTTTSKPEFSFDTPLQSPTMTIPSRSGSPASFQLSRQPTPPVPFRPQHASKSSLSLIRPSPLHNVIIPKPQSPKSASPVVPPPPNMTAPMMATPIDPLPKTVSFAEDDNPEETAIVKRIVEGLPDLSYMLR